MAKGDVFHDRTATVGVVLTWFVLNIAMGCSTKWIFLHGRVCAGTTAPLKPDCKAFDFPLNITLVHMFFSWAMCYIQLVHVRKKSFKILSLADQWQKIAPLSVSFSMSVAMGNLSLLYIYPSFNQMLGAMSPIITVALAVFMQHKRFNSWTWASMPIICGGLALCSVKEVNFNVIGAFFALGATILRAIKSIIQGKLLQGADKMDSVTLLFYMAPWSAAFLFVTALLTEGVEPYKMLFDGIRGYKTNQDGQVQSVTGAPTVLALLACSGMNACMLNVSNFMVTAYTSPVTLQVFGNVKCCLAIATSVAVFRNPMKIEQGFGVATCLFGVWVYHQKSKVVSAPTASEGKSEGSSPMGFKFGDNKIKF